MSVEMTHIYISLSLQHRGSTAQLPTAQLSQQSAQYLWFNTLNTCLLSYVYLRIAQYAQYVLIYLLIAQYAQCTEYVYFNTFNTC